MTNLQTGIAVALAIIVVGGVFVYPSIVPLFAGTVAGAQTTAGDENLTTVPDMANPDTAQIQNMNQNENVDSLQITDEKVGTGAAVAVGDLVTVNYVGTFTDGTVFDASANHGGPIDFPIGVGRVIQGWDQGLIGMKEGGKRRLVVPASLGYGEQGRPGIPGGATLIFEIELLKVTH